MQKEILEIAQNWANNLYFDEQDRNELKNLLNDVPSHTKELTERFYQDLEFGTGGLRSILGFGRNRMNKYNVRKATQAMANALLSQNPKNPKACVSFDCRHFSKEFSEEVARVFAGNGIKTYLFKELTPTPILSFAVRLYKANCGVMVTASHNPKQYNGYKAYWNDGAQVTPPNDQKIIDAYYKIKSFEEIKLLDFKEAFNQGLIEFIDDNLFESFYEEIERNTLNLSLCKEKGKNLNIVFTSLHGTSLIPCTTITKRMGFSNFNVVEEQKSFDGSFPTVKTTPNPEDPIALELAVKKLKELNADVAFGTDPDCDRLGVVVNHKNEIHYLNGNQIAFLMLNYILETRKEKNILSKNPIVIKSIVTSDLQTTIANHYEVKMINTLTGFKWMAMELAKLEESNKPFDFIFASEESFGYLPYKMVRDKDAVSAVALMSEIALFYKLQGKTLIDALDLIYEKFGYAEESLISLTFEGLEGKEKINRIMNYFRENFETSIKNQKVKVFTDYKNLYSLELKTNLKKDIVFERSNVLGLEFESGNTLFLRPSGTEPKIKFYTLIQVKNGSLEKKKEEAKKLIKEIELSVHEIVGRL